VLRDLARALAFTVSLALSLLTRSLAAEPSAARARERSSQLPAPSAADAGWFGLSVGIGTPRLLTTLGAGEASAIEGSAGSAGNYRFLYEKQLFGWIGLRGFMSSTEWGTEQSELSGDGDRALYDLGVAPILSFPVANGRPGLSLFVFAPVSFSWSSAPARAERQVVGETMDIGTGYRIGFGIGLLSRLSARFGLLFELEAAQQHVSHIRHFARRDGSGGEVDLPITYDLRWLGAEVGLAFFP
jgi:hypothetical protein